MSSYLSHNLYNLDHYLIFHYKLYNFFVCFCQNDNNYIILSSNNKHNKPNGQ